MILKTNSGRKDFWEMSGFWDSKSIGLFVAYASPFALKMAFDFLYFGRTFYDPFASNALSSVFRCGALWSYDWPFLMHGLFGVTHYPAVSLCQLSAIFLKFVGISEAAFFPLSVFVLVVLSAVVVGAALWICRLSRIRPIPVEVAFSMSAFAAVSPGGAYYFQIYNFISVLLPPIGIGLYFILRSKEQNKFVLMSTFIGLGFVMANHYSMTVIGAVIFLTLAAGGLSAAGREIIGSLSTIQYSRTYSIIATLSFLLLANGFVMVWTDAWRTVANFTRSDVVQYKAEEIYLFTSVLFIILLVSCFVLVKILSKYLNKAPFIFFVSTIGHGSVGVVAAVNITILDSWQSGVWKTFVARSSSEGISSTTGSLMSASQYLRFLLDHPWHVAAILLLGAGVLGLMRKVWLGNENAASNSLAAIFVVTLALINLFVVWSLVPTLYVTSDEIHFAPGRHLTVLIVAVPMVALFWFADRALYGRLICSGFIAIAFSAFFVDVVQMKEQVSWSKTLEDKTRSVFRAFFETYPDGRVICRSLQPFRCYVSESYEGFVIRFVSNKRNVQRGVPAVINDFKYKFGQKYRDRDDREFLIVSSVTAGGATASPRSRVVYADRYISIRQERGK